MVADKMEASYNFCISISHQRGVGELCCEY